jgi:periplasmic protein TonB
MQPASRNTKSEPRTMQTSLDRCLVDGEMSAASNLRHLRRRALGISFTLEAVALALLIVAPLLTTIAQPNFSRTAFVPFVFSSAHPKHASKTSSNPARVKLNKLRRGITFPVRVHVPAPPATQETDIEIPGGELFLGPAGPGASPFVDVRPASPAEPPRDEIKKSVEKGPIKVSESVVEAKLISRVEPHYPALALQTRLQGTVRLQAIISRDGRITALEVLSGHPLLVQAALDAVRQWRYRPTLLNGEPVEVETSITVHFRMEP